MKLLNFLKGEFANWSKLETIFFPIVILFITIISILKSNNIIALICAICGITYTIFAGKGKISCYFYGIIATLCYSYLAYKNAFWGNLVLNLFYYFPLSIIGVFLWKKHIKKDKQEIQKTKLSNHKRIFYLTLTLLITVVMAQIFVAFNDSSAYLDSFTTVFSGLGMFLTVKRCLEQWYIWFFVNLFSAYMWFQAYLNGGDCMAVVLKWLVYAFLAIYFLHKWNNELKTNHSIN